MPLVPVIEVPNLRSRRHRSPSPQPKGDGEAKIEPEESAEVKVESPDPLAQSQSPEPELQPKRERVKHESPDAKPDLSEPEDDGRDTDGDDWADLKPASEAKRDASQRKNRGGGVHVEAEVKFAPKSDDQSESEIKSERPRARATSPLAKKRVREIASPEDKSDTKPEKKRTRSANHASPSGSASPKTEKKSSGGEDKKPPKGRLSGDELVALFKAAIGDAPKRAVFDDLIPGRTGKQLHDNWT